MKNSNINGNGNTTFSIVLCAILLLIIFFCIFSYTMQRRPIENFDNGCPLDKNFNDPNFLNQRFFHYNNTNKLIPTDPIHVDRNVVQSALYDTEDMDQHFESVKKKRI